MPTPHCQRHLASILTDAWGSVFQSASDRAALVVAGVAGAAPLWQSWVRDFNNAFLSIVPTLGGVFLVFKLTLVAIQVVKEIFSIRNSDRK